VYRITLRLPDTRGGVRFDDELIGNLLYMDFAFALPSRALSEVAKRLTELADKFASRARTSDESIDHRSVADKLTPPSAVLLEWAQKSPPPQEWWDEDFEGL
jgi:hypothetical protein